MPKKKISKVKGYKAFENDLTCRGFQYEIGKEYKLPDGEKLEICESGFHFCKTIADCYSYYPMDGDTRVCEIEALGNIVADEDNIKFATDHIKIVKEITDKDILYCNTGKRNTGYRNSGDYNSGNHNSGDSNSGSCNIGDWNSGHCNFGDNNSGNYNSGDDNSGDWNTGKFSSGCFCTDQIPKIKMFDKESDWTMNDWLESDARKILASMPINSIKWRSFLDMTEEEKEKHPESEVTRGYPKEIKVTKKDRQEWWNELEENDKKEILSLPNFDKYIFYECTKIKVD